GLDDARADRCAALAVAGMQGIIGAWLVRRDAGADRDAEQAVADLSRALALLAEDGGR
ncbi:TetR family transcriptional regulator, partial [Clavibacter lycopersici]